MDALLIVFGMTMMYIYQRYRERVYKRKVRPLTYFTDMLTIAVHATEEHIATQPFIRITSPENRERPSFGNVNQTLVEIVNVKKLPDGYVGQFFEHLTPESRGSAPLWLDRLTLLPTAQTVKVALDVASTDRAHIVKFNPKLMRADLLASTINYYFGLLEK